MGGGVKEPRVGGIQFEERGRIRSGIRTGTEIGGRGGGSEMWSLEGGRGGGAEGFRL